MKIAMKISNGLPNKPRNPRACDRSDRYRPAHGNLLETASCGNIQAYYRFLVPEITAECESSSFLRQFGPLDRSPAMARAVSVRSSRCAPMKN